MRATEKIVTSSSVYPVWASGWTAKRKRRNFRISVLLGLVATCVCRLATSWGITLGECSLIIGSPKSTAITASWRYLPKLRISFWQTGRFNSCKIGYTYSNFNSVAVPRSADSCWINASRTFCGKTHGVLEKICWASTREQTNKTMLKLFMYSAWNQENVTNEVVAIPFFFLKMQRFAIYPLESLEYATLVDQMLQLALKLRRKWTGQITWTAIKAPSIANFWSFTACCISDWMTGVRRCRILSGNLKKKRTWN